MSPAQTDPLSHLRTLVPAESYLLPSSPSYATESEVWSAHRQFQPRLVLRPTTVESLAAVVRYLSTTDLDYNVRSRGYGSASARDVLISMTAIDEFSYDEAREVVTLGAGANWGSLYSRLEEAAPKKMIVGARTPCIGVGGSTLCSGFSWLSHEYGCVSDASNMLDAEVVLADGSVVWASAHPELIWALRGTEGGFGIVTRFKFAVKPFEENGQIWGGPILVPRDGIKEVSKGIATMCARKDVHPKVGLFLYVMRKELMTFLAGGGNEDMLVVHAYDGLGEEHGREDFAWALELEGAIDMTKRNMTMRDVTNLQESIGELRGTSEMYWTPMALSLITEDIVERSFDWWNKVQKEPGTVPNFGYLLFELFSCRDNVTSRASSAWPRPLDYKHMVLIGAGCAPGAGKEENAAAKRLVKDDGPRGILGVEKAEKMVPVPNALEDFHDMKVVYGPHFERLKEVKKKYDPNDRMGGWIRP